MWTGTATSGTGLWSDSANWLGGSVPASGATTAVQFFNNTTTPLPSGTISASNDNAGSFTLNRLVLRGLSPATTATTSVVITGGDLAFGGSAPALTLEGQSSTGVLNYTVANNIAFNADTTLGGDGNAGLTLSGILSGAGTLTKTGASTIQLNGDSSSTFSGGLAIGRGTLQVNGGLGGRLPTSQAITFAGGGAFTFAGNATGATGTVGAVNFQAGSGLVQVFRSGGNNFLTVSSFTTGQGAVARFAQNGGSLGSNTGVRVANQAVGFMGANVAYGGAGFAFYLSGSGTAGYVGNATYGTTANTAALAGNMVSFGTNAHIQYTPTTLASAQASTGTSGGSSVTVATPGNFSVGSIVIGTGVPRWTYVTAISGSTLTLSKPLTGANPSLTSYSAISTQPTATIASLVLSASNGGTVLLDTGATLTISSGGIWRTGNNTNTGSVIAGGAGITTGGTNSIVYWADQQNGGVSIQTPILGTTTGGLIVAGPGTAPLQLAAANTFTGGAWLDGGIVEVASTETPGTSGPFGASGSIRFYGGQLRYSSANTFDYSSRFSTESGQAFSVDTNSQNVTWASSITSVGSSLAKAVAGNLTLSASNAFTSASVSAGLVRIGDASALGGGTVTLSGGGLATADATDRTIVNPIRLAGDATLGIAGGGRLTLAGPVEIVPSSITVTVPSNITSEISGAISGANTAFTLANASGANLILSGNNAAWTPASFSLTNNSITIGHSNALGTGSATFTTNGGSLVVNADLTGVNARANSFVMTGFLTIGGSQGLTTTGSVTGSGGDRTLTNNLPADRLLTLAGPVLLRNGTDTTARTLSFAGNGNTTVSGTIANGGASGSASILKSGTGMLRLTAANTYTGTTGIGAGIVVIAGTDSLPGWNTAGRYSVAAGATLAVGDSVSDADVNTIRTSGNFAANAGIGFDVGAGGRTYAGTAVANTGSGALNLLKIGTGTLTMNAANTYTGTTRIVEGTLRLGVASAIPSTSPVVLTGNGTLDVANSTSAGAVTLSGTGSILGSATLTGSSFAISNTTGTVSVTAILAGSSATFAKSNAGTVALSAANTYQGVTTVSAGVLEFTSIANSGTGNASALGSPTAGNATIALSNGATLRYTGTGGHSSNRTINLSTASTGTATLEAAGTGAVSLGNITGASGNKTLLLTGTSGSDNSLGGIADAASGSVTSLLKQGVGRWILDGSSSFTGSTTIEQGELVLGTDATGGGNGSLGANSSALITIGSVGGSGTAALLLKAGVIVNTRAFTIPGGSQATVIGAADGSGTASFGSTGGTLITLGRDATLQAATGGTLLLSNLWAQASGTSVSVSVGSAGNEGTVVLGQPLAATGTVRIDRGVLRLATSATSAGSLAAASNVVIGPVGSVNPVLNIRDLNVGYSFGTGQTLSGTGTLQLDADSPVSIAGLFSPGNSPGLFTFDGSGTTTLAGTTLMEITGTSRGTAGGYDAVDLVNGSSLALGGALQLWFGSTFSEGTEFNLFTLTGAGLSGNFTSVTMSGSSTAYAGLTWTQDGMAWNSSPTLDGQSLRFNSADGMLVVVPEPATLALAAVGIGLVGWVAFRRRM